MSDFTRPIEDIASYAKEYVDLRLDDLKLRSAKGLSLTVSKLLSLILILGIFTSFVLVLSLGIIFLIGERMGSYAAAAFIVAGVNLIAIIVLFLLKDKLFQGQFVRLFIRIFFGEEDENEA